MATITFEQLMQDTDCEDTDFDSIDFSIESTETVLEMAELVNEYEKAATINDVKNGLNVNTEDMKEFLKKTGEVFKKIFFGLITILQKIFTFIGWIILMPFAWFKKLFKTGNVKGFMKEWTDILKKQFAELDDLYLYTTDYEKWSAKEQSKWEEYSRAWKEDFNRDWDAWSNAFKNSFHGQFDENWWKEFFNQQGGNSYGSAESDRKAENEFQADAATGKDAHISEAQAQKVSAVIVSENISGLFEFAANIDKYEREANDTDRFCKKMMQKIAQTREVLSGNGEKKLDNLTPEIRSIMLDGIKVLRNRVAKFSSDAKTISKYRQLMIHDLKTIEDKIKGIKGTKTESVNFEETYAEFIREYEYRPAA